MNIDILNDSQLSQLDQLIETAGTILITCHKSPDGDAIGSCLGWAEYLRSRGKDAVVIIPDQYPDFLAWLPNTDKIVRYDKHKEKCDMLFKIADLVFCLDYNTTSRVQDMEAALVGSPAPKVLIDHHLDPDVPAVLTISEPEACSTSELVFRIVWQLGDFDKLDKHFAVPVYPAWVLKTWDSSSFAKEFAFDEATPPMCLVHGDADFCTPIASAAVYKKLREMNIPAELHIYAKVKHGFGGSPTDGHIGDWLNRVYAWMNVMGF